MLAMKYEWKKDLLDYISDEALKNKLSKLSEQRKKDYEKVRDKAKDTYEDKLNNASFTFSIEGGINVETNVKFNFLTKSYLITPLGKSIGKDEKGNPIVNYIKYSADNSTASIAFGQYIKGEVELKARYDGVLFKFTPLETKFDGDLEFKISSSFGIVQKYGKDEIGFYVENHLYFSGIKAEITTNLTVKVANGKWKINKPKQDKP
ncbi:MAG: hypothetical protein EOO44_21335, partial [Flavobacterium sp.]